MQIIVNGIKDWMLSFLEGVLNGTFENLSNGLIGIPDIAALSPSVWEGGLPWQMAEAIVRYAMVPVAAIILTYVMSMEIISVIHDKNNFRDIDVTVIYKLIFKMAIAVIIVNNSLKLVAGMYQLGTYLISKASPVIGELTPEAVASAETIIEQLRNNADVTIGNIAFLIIASIVCWLISWAIIIIAYLTVYGRLIEIVIYSSICPIPMATLMNKEWSGIGQNYIKSMFALGVQGFLILFLIGIYSVMLQNATFDFSSSSSLIKDLLMRCVIGLVLCKMLLSTGSITKSIFNAH